jgi:hypothetical protein
MGYPRYVAVEDTLTLCAWESEIYRGVMRARCYPLNMRKHTFRGTNQQVKIKDELGYPLFLSFQSHLEGDNLRYPCMCRIAA